MPYEAFPGNEHGSFELLCSQEAKEMQQFDISELAARATALYRFQLRHKALFFDSEGSVERALVTTIHE